ncbi:NAD-dependent protein deacylase [Paenibacillus eucommiae]|uniref:NAD-dependent protein deacetylase n=1 Tax=Paenibacillus eucommiae TaxID=1355755 RepID=A0ABS4J7D0_9BACL|nr:NAD-dependent protein deacylase [Paenibacillus eucommiae]MBP1995715.1 NAD-dependent deacetylase [Paenibacillus eucommiae]
MNFAELKQMVATSSNIVFFGGAGVSTESNIPDFRSAAGLYQAKNESAYTPEEVLSHSFFMKHTEDFYDFYKSKMIYKDAVPNQAHLALSSLERDGRLKAVITQNIDGLHQMAGNRNVMELHGSVHRNYCMKCNKFFDLSYILNIKNLVPRCDVCDSVVKPDVVLYEEGLDMELLFRARECIANADILIVGGTSLTVNPAAGLVREYAGGKLILINKMPTPFDARADFLINDSIGKVLGALV